jgi:hypothetical protein
MPSHAVSLPELGWKTLAELVEGDALRHEELPQAAGVSFLRFFRGI